MHISSEATVKLRKAQLPQDNGTVTINYNYVSPNVISEPNFHKLCGSEFCGG
jgi:hypothetical protein